ncbi:MAG: sensor histidine kinase [Acetobacteraceae bacterium]
MHGPQGSFRARLIIGAVIWIAAGMATSWILVTGLFRGHIEHEIRLELDHHASELANLAYLDPAGDVRLRNQLSDDRFFVPASHYYWQIDCPDGKIKRSPSLGTSFLPLSLDFDRATDSRVVSATGPTGTMMLLEQIVRPKHDMEPLRIGVAIDVSEIDVVTSRLRQTLALAMGAIAIGLMFAALAQISFGLRPLNRVRQALTAIRRGEANRLPDDLPAEVAPLARNMNALIEANEEVVRRARVQVGNLAHALKTPLGILMDEAQRLDDAGYSGAVILRECERMRRQVEYQLAKARAAASRSGAGTAAPVGATLRSVVSAVERLYRDRSLVFTVAEAHAGTIVACDVEDLEEMLGNLLDNAAKWAASRVRVSLSPSVAGGSEVLRISVEDDGPGMAAEDRERVFRAGERLDEKAPGTGLGLAIVRDVAELYGGRAWIEVASLGGIAAQLELPLVSSA